MKSMFLGGMVALMACSDVFASKPGFGDFQIGMTQREVARMFRTWEREGNLAKPVRDSFIPDEPGLARFLPDRNPYKGIAALVLSFEGRWDSPESVKEMEERNPDARLNEIYVTLAATKNQADHEAFFAVMKRMYGSPRSEKDEKNLRVGGSIQLPDGRTREYRIVRMRSMEWVVPFGPRGEMYQTTAFLSYLDAGVCLPSITIFRSHEVTDEAWKAERSRVKISDDVLRHWSVKADEGFIGRFRFTSQNDKETAPVGLSIIGKDALLWDTLNDIYGKRMITHQDSSIERFQRMRFGGDPAVWHYVRLTGEGYRRLRRPVYWRDANVRELVYIETPREFFRFTIAYDSGDDVDAKRRGLWALVRSWGK